MHLVEDLKCDNWKKGYITQTQLRVDRLHSDFTSGTLWLQVSCGIVKTPLRFKFKMADDAQIFNIFTRISLERLNVVTSNL